MNDVAPRDAIACDMSAIPADERDAHIALARSLFFAGGRAVRETEDGLMVELPPDLLGDVARFVENERRCCRHLAFALEVPAHGADLVLRVTGPGARDELLALAQSHPSATDAEAST
jgi:hypothetical protein